MRPNAKSIFLVFLLGLSGILSVLAAEQPFSLTISTPHPTFKAGEEILIDLVVKNTSKAVRTIGHSNAPRQAEIYYHVSVRQSDGQPARETKYQRQVTGEEPVSLIGSTVYHALEPGQSLHDDLVLNMRKLGVLTTRVAPDLEALGISLAAA